MRGVVTKRLSAEARRKATALGEAGQTSLTSKLMRWVKFQIGVGESAREEKMPSYTVKTKGYRRIFQDLKSANGKRAVNAETLKLMVAAGRIRKARRLRRRKRAEERAKERSKAC